MRIIASGTFDRLHEGHKHFLREAAKRGTVMIAITSDDMHKEKKHAHLIYGYRRRRKDVVDFMEGKGWIYRKNYIIKKIHDKYGFAMKVKDIDAIVVTRDTKKNALFINEKRMQKGWHPLKIIIVGLVKDGKGVISSSRLRSSLAGR